MGEEGAAGDEGGEEQGGGQAALDGKILLNDGFERSLGTKSRHLVVLVTFFKQKKSRARFDLEKANFRQRGLNTCKKLPTFTIHEHLGVSIFEGKYIC